MEGQTPSAESQSTEVEEELLVTRIRDPIHEYIAMPQYMREFMDTTEFQRLRNLKQLGTSYFVWPGASHNRFEHCVGVAHLAHTLVKDLQRRQPRLEIDERDVKCVTLAGLLHDLGHGPFSHVWDGRFIPRVRALRRAKGLLVDDDRPWEHEQGSEAMIDYMVKENALEVAPDELNFIKDLVRGGEPKHSKGRNEKKFLFEIVANKRNGIDVDKFDYIARDTAALEGSANKGSFRLIGSARVIEDEICYNIKDQHTVYKLFMDRWSLHRQFYHHPAATAIELMLVDALIAADDHLKIADRTYQPERFQFLTDDIVFEIERSTDPELEESRRIIERIRRRKLYKMVDFFNYPWDLKEDLENIITAKNIAEMAATVAASEDPPDEVVVTADNIHIDISPIHFGNNNAAPLDRVHFYSKFHPDDKRSATSDTGSFALPAQYGEILVRVYSKDDKLFGRVQVAHRKVREQLVKQEAPLSSSETLLPSPSIPSTPKPLGSSRNVSSSSLDSERLSLENVFTTVDRDYDPSMSPLRSVKKRRMTVAESVEGGSPLAKRPRGKR